MATYTEEGNSIECNKSCIAARGISKKPVLITNLEGVAGRWFKYKGHKRVIATITEELRPRRHKICELSKLLLNDALDADVVEMYFEKRITVEIVSNFSNVHGIQGSHANTFTYAKIVIPWRFVLQRAISNQ